MNTSAVIGTVVVLVIIIGGFFFLGQSKTENLLQPSQSEMPQAANTITYAISGFSPNPIIIKKGEVVMWQNESGRDMWPASATHPTHTIYPEKSSGDCLGSAFDACSSIPSGQSWQFRFNVAGEWNYHDHLRPNNFGKVIVE